MKKFTLALLMLTFIMLSGLSWPSCGGKSSSDTSPTPEPSQTITLNEAPLDTVDAITLEPSLLANLDASAQEAKKWKGNAQIMMVSVKLPLDLSLNNSTETYTYGSADETNYWWTYSLSEQTGKFVRALVYKDDYLGKEMTPINLQYWRTNYVEAFQIAENYQGKQFRSNNSNVTVNLTLSVSEPKNWLWWLVEYKSEDGNSYSVRINPNDRTIADEAGQTIQAGETSTMQAQIETTPIPTVSATVTP